MEEVFSLPHFGDVPILSAIGKTKHLFFFLMFLEIKDGTQHTLNICNKDRVRNRHSIFQLFSLLEFAILTH